MNQHSTGQIHVMNLRILHYSFINHQFHHSTITIKQKNHHKQTCNRATLRSFSVKNSCSNEKRQIPWNSAVKRRIPKRRNPKCRGLARKFHGSRKLWALVISSFRNIIEVASIFYLLSIYFYIKNSNKGVITIHDMNLSVLKKNRRILKFSCK